MYECWLQPTGCCDGYVCSVNDAELIEAVRAGDESSWTLLVRHHSDLVWRVARSVVNDDDSATEVMQATWLKLLENVDTIREPAAVRGWLVTAARREAIAQSKRSGRQRPTDLIDGLVDAGVSPIAASQTRSTDPAIVVGESNQSQILLEELERLGEKCRILLTLYAHNFSYAEIADILDIAPGGVSPSRMRCLEQLRRAPRIARMGTERAAISEEESEK